MVEAFYTNLAVFAIFDYRIPPKNIARVKCKKPNLFIVLVELIHDTFFCDIIFAIVYSSQTI